MNWRKILNISKWFLGIIVALMLLVSALLLVFKDNIKEYALAEANQYLNKRVHIGYIDVGIWKTFPDLTLSFDDVLVHSRFEHEQTKDTAIYAQQINLRFNPIDFFKGKYDVHSIDISEAKLNLEIRKDGSINYDFLKPSSDSSSSPFAFNLNNIQLINTDFSYRNHSTQQYYTGYFKHLDLAGSFNEKQFLLDAETDFVINSIQSKAIKLIENKNAKCEISIKMDQEQNIFEIKTADVSINKLPFLVKGKVTPDSLDFYIGAKNLNLADVAHNFSFKELDVVDEINGKGNVNFELFIQGENQKTSAPAIESTFEVKNGSLSDNGFSLSNINLSGKYSNGVLNGKEEIELSSITFKSLNETFKGQVNITDFNQPRLQGNAKGLLNLKAIHRLFGPFKMQYLTGSIGVNGSFDVRLNQPQIDPKDITIYKLRSTLELESIETQFEKDQRILKVNSGEITIRNQFAGITDLSIALNNSSILLDGEFNHLVDYFKGAGKLKAEANVTSTFLNLDDLSVENNNQQRTKAWLLPNDINGTLILALDKVRYSNHDYENINSKMIFGKHQLTFPILEGENVGIQLKGDLKITEEKPMYLSIETNLRSKNVQFKPLFREWNNFDQTVIQSENIKGNAAIQLYFKGPFDLYNEEIIKEAFDVKAKIKINNGALMHVQTFTEITNSLRNSSAKLLLSKGKINDFEKKLLNLEFDSFENELRIKDGIITIPHMKVKSNALDFSLEGTHSFKNEIDYSFNFRFRELKGNKTSEFGDIKDDGTGFKIFLKMFGTIDNPKFSWDKEAQQIEKQVNKEKAKKDLKSALKTGFGINKKDSTVQEITPKNEEKEDVIMDFGHEDEKDFEPEQKKKKKNALQRKIDQWKKENQEEEKEPDFQFD
ncbi:hypothetical protein CW751_13555 [Brumimicrobium salinarum]|uniref:Uncharacterized protein n=1 Tax=Brumimicrobium salinarum TaxID=2058658 RepID=A0A2I0QZJ1_9FLAO|nr:AsmA-like C-terminal region-containing protein [Brumimicrobium salinarum]PKR79746.1 hypothetical protein CW751_13555 [Brumimicrobium salinarum]